jgi:hypothetical protein
MGFFNFKASAPQANYYIAAEALLNGVGLKQYKYVTHFIIMLQFGVVTPPNVIIKR